MGISTSGGKAKLFDRILSFYDEQQLSFAQEIKASLGPSITIREQRLIQLPTPAERQEHELTHQPYQEWCPACISARGRPDAHKTDVHKVVDKAITSFSFDLSFTGKEFDPTGKPRLIDVEEAWKEKWIVLNGHDSHTGAVFSLPLQKKGETKYMACEISRFVMSLGIGELQLYCDNEPTMLQVLALTQRALMNCGLIFFSCIAGRVRDIVGQQRDENENDQNSLGSEQENTTKSQTNTTNQTPKTKTQARSLSCLGKCKLGETSETCAPLSASQKFSSTSMYFSICPVLNVSHVNICHHVLRRISDIRL